MALFYHIWLSVTMEKIHQYIKKSKFYLIFRLNSAILIKKKNRSTPSPKEKGFIFMLKDNICKFTPESLISEREIFSFVYEKKPKAMMQERILDTNKICLVCHGNITFNYSGSLSRCSAGDIFFLFEGELCYATPEEGADYMYISFKGTRYDELLRRFFISRQRRHFSGFSSIIPIWSESLSRAIEENLDLVAESMLLYALGRFSGDSSERANLINRVIDFTEKNFTSPELSLSTVSAEFNYNPKYVSHLFKKRMGTGYTEYLRLLRLKNAIALFDRGLDSIKNVALLSGFADPLYFSSVFKASIGLSPKEYIYSRRGAKAVFNAEASQSNSDNQ